MSKKLVLIVVIALFIGVLISPYLIVLFPDGSAPQIVSVIFFDFDNKGGLGALMFIYSIWSRIFAVIGIILTAYLLLSDKTSSAPQE